MIALMLLLPLSPFAALQQGELVSRIHDVEPLEALIGEADAFEELEWPQWETGIYWFSGRSDRFKEWEEARTANRYFGSQRPAKGQRPDWDWAFGDALQLAGFGEKALDRSLMLDVPGRRIGVRATSRAHAFLDKFVERVGERLGHLLEFEAVVVSAKEAQDAGLDPVQAVLSHERMAPLLRRLSGSKRHRITAHAGRVARLGSVERRELLLGYGTEAHLSGVSPDPDSSVVRMGLDLFVDARPAVLGGYALRVRGHRTQVETRREHFDFPGGAIREADIPTFHTQRESATAIVEDGGGLLLGTPSKSGTLWLVRVRSLERPPNDIQFLQTGGLTAPGNDRHGLRFLGLQANGGYIVDFDYGLGSLRESLAQAPYTPEELKDALGMVVAQEFPIFWVGSEIYVGVDGDRQRAMRLFLEQEAARFEANVAYELRYAEVEKSSGAELLHQPADWIASQLTRQIRGCCRIGGSSSSVDVVSALYTKDVHSEISGSGHPGHPGQGILNGGTSVEIHSAPTRRGNIALEVEFNHQVVLDESRKRTAAIPGVPHEGKTHGTEITLPATTGARFLAPLEVTRGEWNLVGARDLVGTDRMVIAVIRIAPE